MAARPMAIFIPPPIKNTQPRRENFLRCSSLPMEAPLHRLRAPSICESSTGQAAGFAILDVDYGGSTGYGRSYTRCPQRQLGHRRCRRLRSRRQHLIERRRVDPQKIAIQGGSAGGYTTLAALTFGKRFTVGASYYGVSDLAALAEQTHKFESHYLEGLVGPYPAQKDVYKARSPLYSVDKLHCPVIFFQGTDDHVVPVNQAEKMHEALQARGIYTELVLYEGEQHGFRRAENLRDALQKELAFYLTAWGIAR